MLDQLSGTQVYWLLIIWSVLGFFLVMLALATYERVRTKVAEIYTAHYQITDTDKGDDTD